MKIVIINLQKQIPINPKRIRKTILKVLSSQGRKKSGEISVCFVNNRKIKELNLRYLGKNYPTDVLAFDLTQPRDFPHLFADIVISTDMAASNAKIFKTTPLTELYLYVVHGILHILGYDDKNARQRRITQGKAEYILNRLNIKENI